MVGVNVGILVGIRVGVFVGLGVLVGVGIGVEVGLGVGVKVGGGAATTSIEKDGLVAPNLVLVSEVRAILFLNLKYRCRHLF